MAFNATHFDNHLAARGLSIPGGRQDYPIRLAQIERELGVSVDAFVLARNSPALAARIDAHYAGSPNTLSALKTALRSYHRCMTATPPGF